MQICITDSVDLQKVVPHFTPTTAAYSNRDGGVFLCLISTTSWRIDPPELPELFVDF